VEALTDVPETRCPFLGDLTMESTLIVHDVQMTRTSKVESLFSEFKNVYICTVESKLSGSWGNK